MVKGGDVLCVIVAAVLVVVVVPALVFGAGVVVASRPLAHVVRGACVSAIGCSL